MIAAQTKRTLRTGGISNTIPFTLTEENSNKIKRVLRDTLYSNKPLAVLREYSCNAYDANVENGKGDEPIHVTLPTLENCELRIRDHGKGLSFDEFRNTFCNQQQSICWIFRTW